MAFFHADITRMQQQADCLRKEAGRMAEYSDALRSCVRQLSSLDFINPQKQALEQLCIKTKAQYNALTAMAEGMENIIRLYRENEHRCENDKLETAANAYGGKTQYNFFSTAASVPILSHWKPPFFWREIYPWRQTGGALAIASPCVCTMIVNDILRGRVIIRDGRDKFGNQQ